MTETIATNNYERHVRISTRTNDMGAVEELHARITGKSITLTRVSTKAKPKSFWISEEELDKLMVTRFTYKDWLRRREYILTEAQKLIKEKLQAGDINFRDEYHEDGNDLYEVYRVEGWATDNTYRERETIWQHVALEDLVEQIKDAQQRIAEDNLTPEEREELLWKTNTPVQLTQESDIAWCSVCPAQASSQCQGCKCWFCGQHFLEHMQDNAEFLQEYEDSRKYMDHHYTGGE